MTATTNTSYTLQQNWSNQYNALKDANNAAGSIVGAFKGLGNVSDTNAAGSFTSTQQKAYDQAKQQHLDANAALTSFLRDTSLNYSSESGRLAKIAADTKLTAFERNQADISSQAQAEHAADFAAFKAAQGLGYPALVRPTACSKSPAAAWPQNQFTFLQDF